MIVEMLSWGMIPEILCGGEDERIRREKKGEWRGWGMPEREMDENARVMVWRRILNSEKKIDSIFFSFTYTSIASVVSMTVSPSPN